MEVDARRITRVPGVLQPVTVPASPGTTTTNGVLDMPSFTDLVPTDIDAAGVVGGAFAGPSTIVIPLPGGADLVLFGKVD